MRRIDIIRLIFCCVVCLAVGFVGSFFTNSSMDWYEGLIKPPFNPPAWLFAPVWTILYILMGIAVFLVWQKPVSPAIKLALACFLVQLVFNASWTPVFFGLKQPLIAFGNIILLWLAIAATIICFSRVSQLAAVLLIPYIMWVSFAAVLNAAICILN